MKLEVPRCTMLLALFAFGTPAWAATVKICHVPPGNPANFHTITISENASQAHLAHGDLAGPCAQFCDQLCDDGNACTIDACDASERCEPTHPPVNCDDSNLCTIDSCNPATGCAATPILCTDDDSCTVNACDPLTGSCVAPPLDCGHGICVSIEGEAKCECDNGWMGGSCTIPVDPCDGVDCGHGICVSTEEGGARCECDDGWSGTSCDTQSEPTYNCADRNPCTPENREAGLFYFPADESAEYIQCDEEGGCSVETCPPGLVWDREAYTCTLP